MSMPVVAQQYLQNVCRQLDVPKKDRRQLSKRMKHALFSYLEENPDATVNDICDAFGSPEEYTEGILSMYQPHVISMVRQKKKRQLYGVITGITVLAVILLGIAVYLFSHGGIVTIETFQYVNGENPNPRPEEGTATITYVYEE